MTEPTAPGRKEFVISVVIDSKKTLKHYVLSRNKEGKFQLMDKKEFESILDLVKYYQTEKINEDPEVILKRLMKRQRWELSHDDIEDRRGSLRGGPPGESEVEEEERVRKIVHVAIKQAKLEALAKEQVKEFMREARLMRQLDHPNVVRMYGVAATEEPLMLVMELAAEGALDSYLSKNENLSMEKKTEMSVQAAWGIDYLHGKNVLHRDIASRNCLYGGGQVKLADFGLSRIGDSYQMNPKNKVPIRWLAPETLKTAAYSRKTDVWSYGVLVWEIYNNGADPYTGMAIVEVLKFVKGGAHLELKEKSPKEIGEAIERLCFEKEPAKRASMKEIIHKLESITGMRQPDPSARRRKGECMSVYKNSTKSVYRDASVEFLPDRTVMKTPSENIAGEIDAVSNHSNLRPGKRKHKHRHHNHGHLQ